MIKDSKTHFAAQNSHGHVKEFLRKLSKICARALKKVSQPWCRQYIAPKHWHLPTSPHAVTTQKTNIDIFTAVRTSNLILSCISLTFFILLLFKSYSLIMWPIYMETYNFYRWKIRLLRDDDTSLISVYRAQLLWARYLQRSLEKVRRTSYWKMMQRNVADRNEICILCHALFLCTVNRFWEWRWLSSGLLRAV
jgi:hypothetical protein